MIDCRGCLSGDCSECANHKELKSIYEELELLREQNALLKDSNKLAKMILLDTCGDIAKLVGCKVDPYEPGSGDALCDAVGKVVRERDAYKKAKAENDERFLSERNDALNDVTRLSRELTEAKRALSVARDAALEDAAKIADLQEDRRRAGALNESIPLAKRSEDWFRADECRTIAGFIRMSKGKK